MAAFQAVQVLSRAFVIGPDPQGFAQLFERVVAFVFLIERDGQVDPQPRAGGVREALTELDLDAMTGTFDIVPFVDSVQLLILADAGVVKEGHPVADVPLLDLRAPKARSALPHDEAIRSCN